MAKNEDKNNIESAKLDSQNEHLFVHYLQQTKAEWQRVPTGSKIFTTSVTKKTTWSPDFTVKGEDNELYYFEVKGRLWKEARIKYQHFSKNKDCPAVIFIFENGEAKIDSKSKTTYNEWAVKFGFVPFDTKNWKRSITKTTLETLIKQSKTLNQTKQNTK